MTRTSNENEMPAKAKSKKTTTKKAVPKKRVTKNATRDKKHLQGKTFHFSGNCGWIRRAALVDLVRLQGGTVAKNVTAQLDYLVVGQTRSGGQSTAEKKAQSLNLKQTAGIQLVDVGGFKQLIFPDAAAVVALLRAGPQGVEYFNELRGWSASMRDLSGADLRDADLSGAALMESKLDGCDFRGATLDSVVMPEVTGAKFDGAIGNIIIDAQATGCSFRKFVYTSKDEVWSSLYLKDCDLSGVRIAGVIDSCRAQSCRFDKADLCEARLGESKFIQCSFRNAHLSGSVLSQSNCRQSDFTQANLARADLSAAKLVGANLAKADLRNAVLVDADLTNAIVDGANFKGANVAGVDLSSIDVTKAKGLAEAAAAAPVATIGPHVRDLEQAVSRAHEIESRIEVEGTDGPARIGFNSDGGYGLAPISCEYASESQESSWNAQTVADAMSRLARRCVEPRLSPTSLIARGSRSPVKGKALKELCLAAWYEVFGQTVPSPDELKRLKAGDHDLRQELLAELTAGKTGVAKWNKRPLKQRQQASPFRGVDLAGQSLQRINCDALDFQKSNFAGAKLAKASFLGTQLRSATLDKVDASGSKFLDAKLNDAACEEAILAKCDFRDATMIRANFRKADLRAADFEAADLCGADLSTAKLSGAKFQLTKFDEQTLFPKRFKLPEGLRWVGKGQDPRLEQKMAQVHKAGPIDFAAFMKQLEQDCDSSRLKKALRMLKADSSSCSPKSRAMPSPVSSRARPMPTWSTPAASIRPAALPAAPKT